MDNNAVVAVIGTLLGVITSAVLAYLFQSRASERQRKWALEDEKRRMKRELIQRRIDLIEEATSLMSSVINMTVEHACGLPSAKDVYIIKRIEKRLQEILTSAWNAISIVGSQELKENFEVLSRASITMMEEDSEALDMTDYEAAGKAIIAIGRILDKVRLEY